MQHKGASALRWGQDGALKISPICRSAMQWLDRRTTHAPIERSAAKQSPCCTASSSQITISSAAEFLAEFVPELCRNSAGRRRSALPGSIQVLKEAVQGSMAARSASVVICDVSMLVLEKGSSQKCDCWRIFLYSIYPPQTQTPLKKNVSHFR